MSALIAALPMYDWPERRSEVDAQWASIGNMLRSRGIDAPEILERQTGDLLDFWKRSELLLSQTCWGPMEEGLSDHVQVLGQPSYDGIEGGQGELYSSAIVMRRDDVDGVADAAPPSDGAAHLPLELFRGRRFAYNVPDSLSGRIGIGRDLEVAGVGMEIFTDLIETGGHRASIRAVAAGRADIAAIDCFSWQLAQHYEQPAKELAIVGWTAKRKGLPFITASSTSSKTMATLREALRSAGLI